MTMTNSKKKLLLLFLAILGGFSLAATKLTFVDLTTQVKNILPGANGGTGVNSTATYPTRGTVTVTVASGQLALPTSPIASGPTNCTLQTVSAPGVLTTDVVKLGLSADVTSITGYEPITSGFLRIDAYPTADNVNIKVCNPTSASITPGAMTLNWQDLR